MADATAKLVGPREWVGDDGAYPWPSIETVEVGDGVVACYCVQKMQLARTKHDKPYLRLTLCDCNGEVEARMWDGAKRAAARIEDARFVGVRASVETFRGVRQLKVEVIQPLRVGSDELSLFLPRSPREPKAMAGELEALIDSVGDRPLRRTLDALLGPETETGRRFRRAPAAKRNHHAYVGGLLEHTLSVAGICDRLAEHYGDGIDRDLLVAGALLHDIGKIRELGTEAGFPYSDEGKLLGHILLGLRMVEDAARRVEPLEEERRTLLLHLIASHQGRYEWQSPRQPRILEGMILHYADNLDSKMNQVSALLGEGEEGWSEYHRGFGRDFFRHGGGSGETAGVDPEGDADRAGIGGTDESAPGGAPGVDEPRERREAAESVFDLFSDASRDLPEAD